MPQINNSNILMKYIVLVAILPIEYIALSIDYHTNTMWGYALFLLMMIISAIFINNIKKLMITLLIRLLGGGISSFLIHVSSERFISSGYFKPLSTSEIDIILTVLSLIVLILFFFFRTYKRHRNS